MRLDDYLRPDLVLLDLRASGREEAIRVFASHLAGRAVDSPEDRIEARLLERERAHTTALGRGVAVPHATVEGLERPVLLLAVAPEPVPFGPPESDPVRVFFVLLSPPGREGEHIKILARICRLVQRGEFVGALEAAGDSEELLRIVRRVDAEHV